MTTKKREMLNGVVNRIHRVGIELEGGWDTEPDVAIVHDGSVVFPGQGRRLVAADPDELVFDETGRITVRRRDLVPQQLVPPTYKGEIPTPRGGIQLADIQQWMTKYYPGHVNATCGLHVHMSFLRRMHYQQLMTPEYTIAIVDKLKEWAEARKLAKDHTIWHRLEGKNDQCILEYLGDQQVLIARKDYNSRGKKHNRYTAINYCDKQHGTVECRILPMMDTVDLGISAVMEVLNITNRFLSRIRKRERRHVVSVKSKPETFQEHEVVIR
jgi:hypothetical protein